MSQFVIDHHVLDSINLGGILLGILGFFYVTYEFFGRKPLRWFVRIITPGLIGALILFPAGVLEQAYSCAPRLIYAYSCAPLELVLRGGVIYALVGAMIGMFNGIFIDWPPSPEESSVFSWKGCLIGLVIAFLIWFVSAFIFGGFGHASIIGFPAIAFIEGGILAPMGGIAGGLWHFINRAPFSPSKQLPSSERSLLFSWKGCLIGVLCAFFFGFAIDFILGYIFIPDYTPVTGLIRGAILTVTGGIAGGLWRLFKNEPSISGETPPLFSWKGCLIGLISAFLFGFVSAFLVNIIPDTILLWRGDPRAGDFGIDLAKSLKGALTAAAFIGPAGGITGGISRFIFWRANGLGDGKLGGIGAILTLFGFLVQLLPPLVSILNIPVR